MPPQPHTPHFNQATQTAAKTAKIMTARARASGVSTIMSTSTSAMAAVLLSLLLTSCGQKGALYLPKDAPSNTEFILYKGNKASNTTADNQAVSSDNDNTDNDKDSHSNKPVLDNPNDY